MHALNAYFGKEQVKKEDFDRYIETFDKVLAQDSNYKGMSFRDWDFLYRGSNILTFILLYDYNVYLRFYPVSKCIEESQLNRDFTFVFDSGHIWGIKYVDGSWFKVDSISGVSRMSSLPNSVGLMVPVSPIREMYYRIGRLKFTKNLESDLSIIVSLLEYFSKIYAQTKNRDSAKMLSIINMFRTFESTNQQSILLEMWKVIIELFES